MEGADLISFCAALAGAFCANASKLSHAAQPNSQEHWQGKLHFFLSDKSNKLIVEKRRNWSWAQCIAS